MQMILLGAPITAQDAHAAGLVAQLYENGTVLEEAVRMASQLAGLSTTAVSMAKEAVCQGE